jgi:predicted RNase H-like nuclease (RuvC/YqgF family)
MDRARRAEEEKVRTQERQQRAYQRIRQLKAKIHKLENLVDQQDMEIMGLSDQVSQLQEYL